MAKIFYIMGKSASGKDTLYREIVKRFPEMGTYVMYTTRPARKGEQEGEAYHFVSKERLEAYEDQGKLIEKRIYQTTEGPWIYATVDDGSLNLNQQHILMTGTPESFGKIRAYFGAERVVPLYIETEDGERLKRAILREGMEKHPDYKEICRRFLADEDDFSAEKLKAAGIVEKFRNDDLEDCLTAVMQRIRENEER